MIAGKACLHGRAFCVFGAIPPVGNFAKIHARGRGGLLGTVRKDLIPPWGRGGRRAGTAAAADRWGAGTGPDGGAAQEAQPGRRSGTGKRRAAGRAGHTGRGGGRRAAQPGRAQKRRGGAPSPRRAHNGPRGGRGGGAQGNGPPGAGGADGARAGPNFAGWAAAGAGKRAAGRGAGAGATAARGGPAAKSRLKASGLCRVSARREIRRARRGRFRL